jgi:hypothetical protein
VISQLVVYFWWHFVLSPLADDHGTKNSKTPNLTVSTVFSPPLVTSTPSHGLPRYTDGGTDMSSRKVDF